MRIPTAAGLQKLYGRFYVVQYGDSLYSIAEKFNVTRANLLQANDQIQETDVIHPGEVLFLPSAVPAGKTKGKTHSRKSTGKKKK
ncbi:LysM peptidoglycan-binding domain-containing protein [Xylanibacillus composti]|uniref:LysM domain-containing protein n=1 Tax=Xylanibacillus composti TaxID=1572762 RepID=A0A8J4M005_9BACL|nr:LysM domain-containing protein [Xylanibacillus composti]GIQ67365.1 hypothetical protein XYCOK13_01890 [Xylanibacillus composti]